MPRIEPLIRVRVVVTRRGRADAILPVCTAILCCRSEGMVRLPAHPKLVQNERTFTYRR
jgi:hypothetical protein